MEIEPMQDETDYPDPYKKCKPLNYYDKDIKDCKCKFENDHSNSILLCEECNKLPCHNKE